MNSRGKHEPVLLFFPVYYGYDAQERPAGHALPVDGTNRASVAYGYDAAGRIATLAITNSAGRGLSVAYTNAAGYNAGYTVTLPGGSVFRREVRRDPSFPDRITSCSNFFDNAAMTGYAYQYDILGRPVSRNIDTFAYDRAGQVTNMVHGGRYPKTDSYAYDSAGNRTASSDQSFGILDYTSNALNQYTATTWDQFLYDADGNLVELGEGSQFFWDAENRMVGITNEAIALRYDYDWRHRRVRSEHGSNGRPDDRSFLVYDGWNIVHERVDVYRTSTGWNRFRDLDYFWGPDLSGTLQGAGGVGGLVAVSIGGQYYFPCYDNNGNIIAYVDESGIKVASYTHDAFGATISSSGSMWYIFPHRFSTKHLDDYTGFYDYGYRWYWPEYGRWLNRDPIGEDGGANIYGYNNNNAGNAYDYLGLEVKLNQKNGGVEEYGVVIYIIHETNIKELDLSGDMGVRRAAILSCYSEYSAKNLLRGRENLIQQELSVGPVGIMMNEGIDPNQPNEELANSRKKAGVPEFVPDVDFPRRMNGDRGPSKKAFIEYALTVFTAAKKEAENMCNQIPDNNRCRQTTLKFLAPNSSDQKTYVDLAISAAKVEWNNSIGMASNSSATFNCKKKCWKSSLNYALFRDNRCSP